MIEINTFPLPVLKIRLLSKLPHCWKYHDSLNQCYHLYFFLYFVIKFCYSSFWNGILTVVYYKTQSNYTRINMRTYFKEYSTLLFFIWNLRGGKSGHLYWTVYHVIDSITNLLNCKTHSVLTLTLWVKTILTSFPTWKNWDMGKLNNCSRLGTCK